MTVCKLCKAKKWYMEADLVHQVQHAAPGKVIRAHLDIQLHHTVAFLWVLGLGAAASHIGVKAAAEVPHCKRYGGHCLYYGVHIVTYMYSRCIASKAGEVLELAHL